ncbi:hypothetical protein GGR53DRAFT_528577 [Hypoxylon sp. FL1150]|nr:hypothetical protein GGR53DRAFT_528577 [Hypoxylon sp. FL1150]
MALRAPGPTASSVRWAFKEDKYRRTSLFSDAVTELKGAIQRRKKLRDDASDPIRKPGRLTFDDLPYDVKDIIFDMIRSSPSWVRFKIRRGWLDGFSGGHLEMLVNKEWYQSLRLRQGLSCNEPLDRMILGDDIQAAIAKNRQVDRGEGPFNVKINRSTLNLCFLKSPFVRRDVDWFFFDGTANIDTSHGYLPQIRTCAIHLDDIYNAIIHDTEDEDGGEPLAPKFMWSPESQVEELVILVGEFRKDVQPSEMKDLLALELQALASVDADDLKPLIYDMLGPEYPHYSKISNSDLFMMKKISLHLAKRDHDRRITRMDFLSSAGRAFLAKGTPAWWEDFSRWITTTEGESWLVNRGFLKSKDSHWWLASKWGSPWLETASGTRWLGTKDAKAFLDSDWALKWAYKGAYDMPGFGKQVRKAWFDTPAGRGWKIERCPDNNPPKVPKLKAPMETQPPLVNSCPQVFHWNYNFRGWRFVMCPEEFEQGPKWEKRSEQE